MRNNSQFALVIINYHYIRRRNDYPYPGIHPIDPELFERQVKWLHKNFYAATPDEVEAFAYGDFKLKNHSFLLTFDDGLIDHYLAAENLLKELDLKAVFSVCSKPIKEQHALMVHKIQWLRATTHPGNFYAEFIRQLSIHRRVENYLTEFNKRATQTYPYDTLKDANLKYLINFELPPEVVDEISSELLLQRGVSEEDFCRELYIDENRLARLSRFGHKLAAHGHSHRPFSKISSDQVDREVEENISCLYAISGKPLNWVCYPYGRRWSLPESVELFCNRFGFRVGLGLNGKSNTDRILPFCLSRINTNEVEFICTNLISK